MIIIDILLKWFEVLKKLYQERFLSVFLLIIDQTYNNTHVVMFGPINYKGKESQTAIPLF